MSTPLILNRKSLSLFAILFLVSAVLLHSFYLETKTEHVVFRQKIEQEVNAAIFFVEQDLASILQENELGNLFREETKYATYIFEDSSLIFWSSNVFVPAYEEIYCPDKFNFLSNATGDYIVVRDTLRRDGGFTEAYALIPLVNRYEIANSYLSPSFNLDLLINEDIKVSENNVSGHKIYSDEEIYLFSVDFGKSYSLGSKQLNDIILLLSLLFLLSLILIVYSYSRQLVSSGKSAWGFLILLLSLSLLRFLLLKLNFPSFLGAYELFASKNFASSSISPSLGDLLINLSLIFLFSLFVFRYYHRSLLYKQFVRASKIKKMIFLSMAIAASFFLLLAVQELVLTIYQHSSIDLDITTSIQFNFLRIAAYVSILLMGLIYCVLTYVIIRLYCRFVNTRRGPFSITFLMGMVIFLLITLAYAASIWVVLIVNVVYLSVLIFTGFHSSLSRITYQTYLYVFLSVIVLALLNAYSIAISELEDEVNRKDKFASQLLVQSDPYAEYLIVEAAEQIMNDKFIQNSMAFPYGSKEAVKNKIKKAYLNNYFDKYDVNILLYNAKGISYTERNSTDQFYYEIEEDLSSSHYATDYERLFLINELGINKFKKYRMMIPVQKWDLPAGYVIIDFRLKKIIPHSVYPELLVDQRFNEATNEKNFSYAVFDKNTLIYNSGNVSEVASLLKLVNEDDRVFLRGIFRENHHVWAGKNEQGKVVLIVSPFDVLSKLLSNFSFIFIMAISIVLIMMLLMALYSLYHGLTIPYSTKIQLFQNLAFFIPLLAVSVTTLSLISNSYSNALREQYTKKAQQLTSNISSLGEEYFSTEIKLRDKIESISRSSDVDMNVFGVDGMLIYSSQPMVYDYNLLSYYLNPKALTAIVHNQRSTVVLDEMVGNLNYKATYAAIKSYKTGNLLGILSVPYFGSAQELDAEIIQVLKKVINIFSLIFICFLVISYFISQSLISPLKYIADKLKATSLTGNEPMEWGAKDEIGMLIGEYNSMLLKLEESKKAIAKSEKESAWREMAQQVAHEIKNPLTPMKLSLQHLQRTSLANKDANTDATQKTVNALLGQVDTLNDIATSFSVFAKMPIPEKKRFELTAVVKKSIDLFVADNHPILQEIEERACYVMGDEKLFVRILNNLIINAFQAMPKHQVAEVKVLVCALEDDMVMIQIIDNGEGIAAEIQDKVFVPNFTTKTTGSGIGLAIAKRGVEHAGGTIHFESEPGEGTVFTIELPLLS